MPDVIRHPERDAYAFRLDEICMFRLRFRYRSRQRIRWVSPNGMPDGIALGILKGYQPLPVPENTVGGGSNPQCASGITRGNPLHEDMMEIAAFVNPDFIVNVVPNLDGRIIVKQIYGVRIAAQADISTSTERILRHETRRGFHHPGRVPPDAGSARIFRLFSVGGSLFA